MAKGIERMLQTGSAAALLVVACSSGNSGTGNSGTLPLSATCSTGPISNVQPRSVAADGENLDSTCTSVAGGLAWKMLPTGAACADPLDCTPVCCPCANGTHHALTTWCNNGTCAAPDAVCCMVLGTLLGTACRG